MESEGDFFSVALVILLCISALDHLQCNMTLKWVINIDKHSSGGWELNNCNTDHMPVG